jgi:glycosyltransferase involved in cell wall biosynthesis
MSAPLVSIIIPTHNRPGLLLEAIQSVARQHYANWEAIIVDDGSQPPVPIGELILQFGPRVRGVRHESPRGGPAAKNSGAEASQGEVLAFLDDDDLYAPTYIERAIQVLNSHPELDLLFMGVSWFGSNAPYGESAYRQSMDKTLAEANGIQIESGVLGFDDRLVKSLLRRIPMAFQRPVVRHQAFLRIGGYQEGCLLWDCDWALQAVINAKTGLITEGLYLQRADGQGYSSKSNRQLEQLLSNVEIGERLLLQMFAKGTSKAELKTFREATSNRWRNLAYYYYELGLVEKSLAAWWASQRHVVNFAHGKFLLRLFLSAFRHKSK